MLCHLCCTLSRNRLSCQLDQLISRLVALIDRHVVERVRHSEQYFALISDVITSDIKLCELLLRHNCPARLLRFLLGDKATTSLFPETGAGDASRGCDVTSSRAGDGSGLVSRRWTSVTVARHLHQLHRAFAAFIFHSDLSSLQNVKTREDTDDVNMDVDSSKVKIDDAIRATIEGSLSHRCS